MQLPRSSPRRMTSEVVSSPTATRPEETIRTKEENVFLRQQVSFHCSNTALARLLSDGWCNLYDEHIICLVIFTTTGVGTSTFETTEPTS